VLTTTQVRDIMREFGCKTIYTNKVKAEKERSVKCYLPTDSAVAKLLLAKLDGAAGANCVNTHKQSSYHRVALCSVTVRCVIA
jgi:hypothetical protein